MGNESDSVGDSGFRIEVVAGPSFKPTPRLQAALQELRASIDEIADPDVSGFGFGIIVDGPFPTLAPNSLKAGAAEVLMETVNYRVALRTGPFIK